MGELEEALRASSGGKRGGPTGMVIEQIKLFSSEAKEELLKFLQRCYDAAEFPAAWARAEV
eukprot:13386456-Alexandrium_andersonii.AAC.1